MDDLKIVDGIPRGLTMRVTLQGGKKPNTIQIEQALRRWFEKCGYKVHRLDVTAENIPCRRAFKISS